ncbi:DUF3099 domain-containing protein [Actinotalea sp. Marseille-Q4924]|uniref:DUF3099 domain-containing protein n=1 Tax=Actinotalea sp. Marseille-Q4924 TaxID=2866571 RepID=UPI001CE41253|nr:DUF3099 domain-containing protein [Actinotalea sp. Marseille-Q4924]
MSVIRGLPSGGARPTAGRGSSPAAGEVHRITSARQSLQEDIAARNKRYMLQMSTRVVCFLGAVVLDHWSRWVLVAGAVFLPYIAVVLANAGREKATDPGTYVDAAADPRALPSRPSEPVMTFADETVPTSPRPARAGDTSTGSRGR